MLWYNLLQLIRNTIIITIFFLLLSVDFSVSTVIQATLLSLLSITIASILLPKSKTTQRAKLKINFIYYAIWLAKEIFLSSIEMIKIIITPASVKKIVPVIDVIHTQQVNDQAKAIFADSITLTPGTITINAEKDNMIIHAISKSHLKSLRRSQMDTLIRKSQNL